jgi:Tol biopolymer transport system component
MTSKTLQVLSVLLAAILCIGGCEDSGGTIRGGPQVSIDVSSNGLVVFSATGEGGSDLYLYDISTDKARCLARTPDNEQTPAFDPSGALIVCSASAQPGGSGHIYVRPVMGGAVRQVTFDNTVFDYGPRFSPDGSRIAFARARLHRPYSMGGSVWDNWDICVINANGTGLRRLTNEDYYEAYPP